MGIQDLGSRCLGLGGLAFLEQGFGSHALGFRD